THQQKRQNNKKSEQAKKKSLQEEAGKAHYSKGDGGLYYHCKPMLYTQSSKVSNTGDGYMPSSTKEAKGSLQLLIAKNTCCFLFSSRFRSLFLLCT
ncbi:hypothetical protein Gotur_009617, partial [Gossypium turneri]